MINLTKLSSCCYSGPCHLRTLQGKETCVVQTESSKRTIFCDKVSLESGHHVADNKHDITISVSYFPENNGDDSQKQKSLKRLGQCVIFRSRFRVQCAMHVRAYNDLDIIDYKLYTTGHRTISIGKEHRVQVGRDDHTGRHQYVPRRSS